MNSPVIWYIAEINQKGYNNIISNYDINALIPHGVKIEIKSGPYYSFSEALDTDIKEDLVRMVDQI